MGAEARYSRLPPASADPQAALALAFGLYLQATRACHASVHEHVLANYPRAELDLKDPERIGFVKKTVWPSQQKAHQVPSGGG